MAAVSLVSTADASVPAMTEFHKAQWMDDEIQPVISWLEKGGDRPPWQEVSTQ